VPGGGRVDDDALRPGGICTDLGGFGDLMPGQDDLGVGGGARPAALQVLDIDGRQSPGPQEQRLQALHPLTRHQPFGEADQLAEQLLAQHPAVDARDARHRLAGVHVRPGPQRQ